MAIPIETVSTPDFTMDYFRFGTGEKTLVILPGLSVQSVMKLADAVAEAYAALAEDFTIYLFDRRAQLPPVYPVEEMARDTARVMDALGLTQVYLFGASQGGMIALVLAIERPDLVKKMVLGSTSAHVRPEQAGMLERWISLAEAGDRKGLYLAFGEDIYPPAVFRQCRDMLLAGAETATDEDLARFVVLTRGSEGFDVSGRLEEIQCPVLAIGVYEDAVLDSDATMEIAEKLDTRPGFRLFLYIGYGHAAFDTAPDYRDRMRAFFLAD